MNVAGRGNEIGDTCIHQRGEARQVLLARNGVELARNVEVEERGEAGVLTDEPERHVAGQEVAQRLLAGDEGVEAPALHQRAAVERIARTAQRDDFIVVALLDAALDDDEQAFGSAIARNDRFARTEIADVKRIADNLELFQAQTIERRVVRVKRQRHPRVLPR